MAVLTTMRMMTQKLTTAVTCSLPGKCWNMQSIATAQVFPSISSSWQVTLGALFASDMACTNGVYASGQMIRGMILQALGATFLNTLVHLVKCYFHRF